MAGFDPKPTQINGSRPGEVHVSFTCLHAVPLLNAAKNIGSGPWSLPESFYQI